MENTYTHNQTTAEHLTERAVSLVEGEIEKAIERSGLSWESVIDKFVEFAPGVGLTDSYYGEFLEGMIKDGSLSIKEYALLLYILTSQPLFAVSPVSTSDDDAAIEWKNK